MLSKTEIKVKSRKKCINEISNNNSNSKNNRLLNNNLQSKNKKINIGYNSPSPYRVIINTPLYKIYHIYSNTKIKSSTIDKTVKRGGSIIKSKKIYFNKNKEKKPEGKNINYITSFNCFGNNYPLKGFNFYNSRSRNISNNVSIKKSINLVNLENFSSKKISKSFSIDKNNKTNNKIIQTHKNWRINSNKNSGIKDNKNKCKIIHRQKKEKFENNKIKQKSLIDGKNIGNGLSKKKINIKLYHKEIKVN